MPRPPSAMLRSLDKWFDNPVYRLERGTRPIWRYLIRATFPAWALVPLVPIAVGLFVSLTQPTGLAARSVMPIMLGGWMLMFVYPVWAAGTVVLEWENRGQMEAIRTTPLAPAEIARGLALAAGVRCAFVMAALCAGFLVTGLILVSMHWARTGEVRLAGLLMLGYILALQIVAYLALVMTPNIIVGLWAALRWRRSTTPRLAIAATALAAEAPAILLCGSFYLIGKVIIGWLVWRDLQTILRRLKD